MKKKILIDATSVTPRVDGLSNYIISLIKYLPSESFEEFEFTVLINKGLRKEEFTSFIRAGKFNVLEKKIASIGPKRDWNMFWFLLKYRNKFDLIHITSSNYPFALSKGVCTIHDITFKEYFDNPWYSFNQATTYMNAVIRNCLRKSAAVIAISNSTKDDLIKWYKVSEQERKKITVIYEGWEHLKNYNNDVCGNNFPSENNYIFYLGSLRKHKNISALLKAFRFAMDKIPEDKKLVISGDSKYLSQSDKQLVSEINKEKERVNFTGYLSNACVEKFFRNADAFIFPSLSEGFGIPIIEAFFYNVPLLCSNTTSFPEVAGNAAIYFDPHDAENISSAIINFYIDPSIAQILIDEGKKQLQNFSWVKTSQQTVDVYRACISKSNS
jgi:glycosyltransferase involved in cell wall biosynthesis